MSDVFQVLLCPLPRPFSNPLRMRHRSDCELSPLVAGDIHHQEDQHGDNVLALIESALYLVDTAPGGPEHFEADLYGMTLGRVSCNINSTK
jgi:hypothetical protein